MHKNGTFCSLTIVHNYKQRLNLKPAARLGHIRAHRTHMQAYSSRYNVPVMPSRSSPVPLTARPPAVHARRRLVRRHAQLLVLVESKRRRTLAPHRQPAHAHMEHRAIGAVALHHRPLQAVIDGRTSLRLSAVHQRGRVARAQPLIEERLCGADQVTRRLAVGAAHKVPAVAGNGQLDERRAQRAPEAGGLVGGNALAGGVTEQLVGGAGAAREQIVPGAPVEGRAVGEVGELGADRLVEAEVVGCRRRLEDGRDGGGQQRKGCDGAEG